MSEQNRRAVELEPLVPDTGTKRPTPTGGSPSKAPKSPSEAEERQTLRQAPSGAAPGESAQNDSIG